MVKEYFLECLEKPEGILDSQTHQLKAIVDKYPYFQPAQAMYLKTLKGQQSFKYNNQLKITASHTTDRSILFNFITSEAYNKTQPSVVITEPIKSLDTEEIVTLKKAKDLKKDLGIGKPLTFNKSEVYSFQKWLELSSNQPIVRTKKQPKQTNNNLDIIDRFILNSPKISKLDKTALPEVKVIDQDDQPQLMTETLAKVYLEQKKYENAIKAYEILSLKYPEKSGYFADQIKRIRILQKK